MILTYVSGLLQGLTLVSVPALSAVFKQGFGLSDANYGALFLPQLVCAVAGAVAGGSLAGRVGLRLLLVLALLCNGGSQGLLAAMAVSPVPLAFPLLLASTAILGLGFGLTGAPLNGYPPLFFPRQANAALVAIHTCIGLGLALGPLLAGELVRLGTWYLLPAGLGGLCLLLAVGTVGARLPRRRQEPVPAAGPAPASRPMTRVAFWIFVAIAVLYAFAEGTFANWVVVYLSEGRGIAEATAALALSAFWAALVAGRLLVSALVTRVPPAIPWLCLPVLMVAAFLLLPGVAGSSDAILLFGFAGLACSAFFPLTIALATGRFPDHGAWVASMMIAALMVGVGLGSFAIGTLRQALTFEDLYRLSAIYPAAALCLGLTVLRRADKVRADSASS